MKKLLALILAISFSLSLTACGGNGASAESMDPEVTLVSKEANLMSLLVEQEVVFTYKTGANSSLEANLNAIIDSISLK